jgi:hypothetical protein
MSGFGADLKADPEQNANVVGSLNKPFTSELLLKTVETYMPQQTAPSEISAEQASSTQEEQSGTTSDLGHSADFASTSPEAEQPVVETRDAEGSLAPASSEPAEINRIETAVGGSDDAWWSAAPSPAASVAATPAETTGEIGSSTDHSANQATPAEEIPVPSGAAYFCGDTSFFSLNWALHTIASQKLTGALRCFWNRETVELLSRDGEILLATTRDPELYCADAPITLVNVEQGRIAAAREQQRATGSPFFLTLSQEEAIIREPAVQLVQHYGQKLFAQLWTASRVRFMFEQTELPDYTNDFPGESDIDFWTLGTLRFIQSQDLGARADYDPSSIPAYTRDGFERVQKLRLTVAEAQFASQFNGTRSIAQIAKNLRLDLKFARLTLFRFLALEIVECWPPAAGVTQEKRGMFGRMFGG